MILYKDDAKNENIVMQSQDIGCDGNDEIYASNMGELRKSKMIYNTQFIKEKRENLTLIITTYKHIKDIKCDNSKILYNYDIVNVKS